LNGKNKINNKDKDELKKFNKIFERVINYVKLINDSKLYEELISTMDLYMKNINGINDLCIKILNIFEIIRNKEENLSLSNYNFLYRFIANIKNNIYEEKLNETILLKEIIRIIKKLFAFQDEQNILYSLILISQILNLNFNLNKENVIFLLTKSFENVNNYDEINDIIALNTCLGIIFYPDITFKFLNSKSNDYYSSKSNFNIFIDLLISIYNNDGFYNLLINKYIILGICKILTNVKYIALIKKEKNNLYNLILVLIQLIEKQKSKKNNILNNITKKHINFEFVGEEEVEEDNDEFDNDYSDIDIVIEFALNNNDDIINYDEFKLFSMVVKYIKKYESEVYEYFNNNIIHGKNKKIEELCKIRNVKIIYNEKEYIICRKIYNLKKSINNSS